MVKKPQKQDDVFHSMNGKSDVILTPGVIILFLILILGGIATGYFLSQKGVSGGGSSTATTATNSNALQKGVMYGSTDTQTFKDMAQGVLQVGGIDGEGQYHLVRPGGDSQNVYMTSSLVDLSRFVGHKVQVWGQTQTAQHAGWLMDVGRVEVLQ